jgi:hypothetical protein
VLVTRRDMCTCKEQYPGASQQNTANYLSHLLGKHISQHSVGDILSKVKIKSKAVLLCVMEAHGGRGGIAPTHT